MPTRSTGRPNMLSSADRSVDQRPCPNIRMFGNRER
jgi:hypothetical protein